MGSLGYCVGVILGDGHLSRFDNRIMLGVTDKSFAEKFARSLSEIIKKKVNVVARKQRTKNFCTRAGKPYTFTTKVYWIQAHSKKWHKKFNNYLKRWEKLTKAELKDVINGLFDSDGSIWGSKNKEGRKYFNVGFCSTTKQLLLAIKRVLKSFGISNARMHFMGYPNPSRKDLYRLTFQRRKDVQKFYETFDSFKFKKVKEGELYG